ncbi:AraC family transcriptional regulator [Sesbania bispinosa]|nr:AraC family transcriptional regulator [Sesbania bispinosa]
MKLKISNPTNKGFFSSSSPLSFINPPLENPQCSLDRVPPGHKWFRCGVSSTVDMFSMLDVNPPLEDASEDASMEAPRRPEFLVPDNDVERETFDEVAEGKGSGIRIESSTASPTSAVSTVQFHSSTITGLDLF